MASAWPSTLPQSLLLNGASKGVGDGLIEYQPDTGPSTTRRRSSAVMRPLSGAMILTDSQIATFETFFYTTILFGALPFTFPDPISGAPLLVKFTKAALPSYVPLGANNYQLSLSLLVLP
jgi:hypothetical protein